MCFLNTFLIWYIWLWECWSVRHHFVLSFSVSVCLNNGWLKKTRVWAICVSPLMLQLITDLERKHSYGQLQPFHHIQPFLSLHEGEVFAFSSHCLSLFLFFFRGVIKCGLSWIYFTTEHLLRGAWASVVPYTWSVKKETQSGLRVLLIASLWLFTYCILYMSFHCF